MKLSKISWTDFSGGAANFVTGCTPVSPGCANCYARRIYEQFGRDFSEVTMHPDKLERLARTKFPEYSPKRGAPHKPMVFVCDTGDLFHEKIPYDTAILAAFMTMTVREDVIWQVLTKRPERMREFVSHYFQFVPDHIWLGVSVENQAAADERIPLLLDTPAAVRFVSLEPMLEPVDLRPWMFDGMPHDHHPKYKRYEYPTGALDWTIVGAESGPNRRPFRWDWAFEVLDQCRAAGVPCFFKQDSGYRPGVLLLDRQGYEVKEWPR